MGVDVTRSFFLKPTDITDVERFRGSICAFDYVMSWTWCNFCFNA